MLEIVKISKHNYEKHLFLGRRQITIIAEGWNKWGGARGGLETLEQKLICGGWVEKML